MIKIDLVWIALLSLLLICSISCVVLSLITFKQKTENNSFLRTFPYEVADKNNKLASIYRVLLYIYCGLCFGPLFDIVPNITSFSGLEDLGITISCMFGLVGLVNVALHLFEAKFPKTHTIAATISFSLTALVGGLTCLFSVLVYNVNEKFGSGNPFSIALAIIAGVLALFCLLIALNPKLRNWAKLEQVKNSEGEVTYKRPKIFWLAFSEWLVMGLSILIEIVFYLSFIK